MINMSTPTPTNHTMRSIEPIRDRSTKNSLATTTASRAAPPSHAGRFDFRAAMSIADKARAAQKIDSAVCVRVERANDSSENGTPAHWCSVLSKTPFAQTKTNADKHVG